MDRDERQRIIQEFAGKHFSLTDKPVAGRANTAEQKRQVIERLYVLWAENPKMRLGQLIGNMYSSTDPGGNNMYYAEDFELIEELEGFYERHETD
jgi:hypothetical protein